MSPSIEIELFLPEGIALLEAGSSSGDFELNELSTVEKVMKELCGEI